MSERRDWMPLTSAEQREFDKVWMQNILSNTLWRWGWKPQLRDQLPAHYKEMKVRTQPCPVQDYRDPFVYFNVREYLGVDIDGMIGIHIDQLTEEVIDDWKSQAQSLSNVSDV